MLKNSDSKKFGLYIHIPFCKQKCSYCDFFSYTKDFDDKLIKKYISYLLKELEIRLKEIKDKNIIIDTIYIGGGTPSLIEATEYRYFFDRLFNIIKKSNIVELTVEINPESTNEQLLSFLQGFNFSRLSIGIQSINELALAEISRIAKIKDIDNALLMIANSKIKNISVDFIHSLPHNASLATKKDIEYVMNRVNVKHISMYFLELADGNIYKDKWQSLSMNEDESADDYMLTLEHLYSKGFEHYEVSNFCLGWQYQSKHNLHYWDMDNYIGLGLSACGYHNNLRYTNTKNIKDYFASIDGSIESNFNNKILCSVETLTDADRKNEFIFLSLRKSIGLSIKKYSALFGLSFFDEYHSIIKKYESCFNITSDYISIKDSAMLYANKIVCSFFV